MMMKRPTTAWAYVTRHHGTGQTAIFHKLVTRLFARAAEDITATHNVALFSIG